MCGIAGMFTKRRHREELISMGGDMINQLYHRGPDGNGLVIRDSKYGERILLAHTRLSINDLTDLGAQPMSSDDGTYWIVFNGEIYNFIELRKELEALGHSFKSRSDTEVILAAWSQWGVDCFSRFIGMWAMALWDESQNVFLLSRDRLGVKPLYFSRDDGELLFASEPKAMLKHLRRRSTLNFQALSDYFSFRQPLDCETFFDGIESLEPGTCLILRDGRETKFRYWELPIVGNKFDPGESRVNEQIDELLTSSVEMRLIADVPVGAYLSGGLDSSALVALMSKIRQSPLKTYTIGFDELEFNEFRYATEVAKKFSCEHQEVLLKPKDYFSKMEHMIFKKDAPLAVPNEIALHVLSKILKKDVTVVLSGEGADELFGGYGRIFRSALDFQRVREAGGVNNLHKSLKENLSLSYEGIEWGSMAQHFLSQYSYMPVADKDNLFSQEAKEAVGVDPHRQRYFGTLFEKLKGLDAQEQYMWVFQKIHLAGLLARLDSSTMSASVEGRVPFTDHRLVEYVSALPLHYKMRWLNKSAQNTSLKLSGAQISGSYDVTKYSLRKVMENKLPSSILNRKKVGFPVPLTDWFSSDYTKLVEDTLLPSDAKIRRLFNKKALMHLIRGPKFSGSSGLQIWMLINLELWMRAYDIDV